jgi:hypothetical protein
MQKWYAYALSHKTMHTYKHTYIHTCKLGINAYKHTYKHTCIPRAEYTL